MINLKEKITLITGAGRGIGREIAIKFAQASSHIGLLDINEESLIETQQLLKPFQIKTKYYLLDISNYKTAEQFSEEFLKDFGRIDILINNAGITRDSLIMRMSEEDWDIVLKVNLKGAFNMIKVFSRSMLSQRSGRIINISSVIGIMGNAGQVNYSASKAGLIGLTKSVAKEFAPRNITVNAVAPGYIQTQMTENLSSDVKEKYLQLIPLKRAGTPEDVANVCLFLASDLASYVTGQVIHCDGGMLM